MLTTASSRNRRRNAKHELLQAASVGGRRCTIGPAAVCLPLHTPRRMRTRTLDRPSTRPRLQSGDAELAENASDAESSAEEDDEGGLQVNSPPPPIKKRVVPLLYLVAQGHTQVQVGASDPDIVPDPGRNLDYSASRAFWRQCSSFWSEKFLRSLA
jgi:hypothetical protein